MQTEPIQGSDSELARLAALQQQFTQRIEMLELALARLRGNDMRALTGGLASHADKVVEDGTRTTGVA